MTSGTIATPCAGQPQLHCFKCNRTLRRAFWLQRGAGYDLATGLGSVNAYNLVHNWIRPTTSSTTTLSLNGGAAVNITHGQSVSFSIAVSPSAAPGDVSLIGSPTGGGFLPLASFPLQNGTATGTTTSLAGGTSYQVKAHYLGRGLLLPAIQRR